MYVYTSNWWLKLGSREKLGDIILVMNSVAEKLFLV